MSTNTKAFIGIDAGTTGCTVMIFDEKGNALGHGYKEYPSESPFAGWGEQSLEKVPHGEWSRVASELADCRHRLHDEHSGESD